MTESNEQRLQRTLLRGQAQIAFAQEALRGVVILNGGAALALLTFIGSAWTSNAKQGLVVIMSLKLGLVVFIAGALSGIIAQGIAYIAQEYFVEDRLVGGKRWRFLCVFCALLSMGCFALGAYKCVEGMAR